MKQDNKVGEIMSIMNYGCRQNMTGLRTAALVGLWTTAFGACGSTSSSRQDPQILATAAASECPAPVKRSIVRVVYGPGQATAVWKLPAGMLGAESPRDLALLQKHVEGISERLTAESSKEADRIVRYEPNATGAAITVEDANVDRLDQTRDEFDRYAALSNQGECATTALLSKSTPLASAD